MAIIRGKSKVRVVTGLMNLFWLALFVAVGFPIALGIELFLRRGRKAVAEHHPVLHDSEFMPLPSDSGIARRMREPVHAAMPERE
jgi:hypothetical protein